MQTSIILSCLFALSAMALPTPQEHVHHKHSKRSNTCAFPTDKDLVEITPKSDNAGWAMSPDQSCSSGTWCPFACPPGQLMNQWDSSVTSYSYPGSQHGGLYCNDDGELEVPYSDRDYCVDGKKTVSVKNTAGDEVAFCQTVLPGNEAMLIPTSVKAGDSQVLAVPGTDYWASTSAHYYVNPPGVSTDDGCVWGSTANPYGNWSPYVAGMNMDDSGNTYVKVGWNPVYFEDSSPFKDQNPSFGLKVTCDDESKCNGGSCTINPKTVGLNKVKSDSAGESLDAAYCVITASDYGSATIEVFDL
ncbi:unnamed protein product [Kuraishia capsulata CBS 1993]|uniref:Uncharacterized protein n=1 Tax=Kuraishia capsulata CBS 1993 TaxID=1382522 RepID=W6MSQ7_9ASCO|nr:uncharacterized protein KUCA_T00005737001 [Kuraishia capsulata CBS 1993]CDK29744.1 unnamed protein product [Kuraishia capsulata CBS 1993]